MCNEDGTVWVAYNGEIYNHRELRAELEQRGHRFVSSSDTEVIVHSYEQYGVPELFHRLRGMFALALYDGRTHEPTLVLARDRFGIKPLYYACADGRVLFASEVRALRRSGLIPLEEDSRAWLAFLCFGSVPTPWTTLRTVRALEPGHWLVASCGDVRLKRYYSLGSLFQPKDLNSDGKGSVLREEFPARLRHKLQEAVGIHLISDAPLGVFLSGGIDSSCLVALATEEKPDLITLGVTFQEQSFSEERYQRIVVERFNTRHHSVSVRFADFQEELPGFWDSLDQPTVDGVNTYFVARAAQQVGLKTVLSGIGGDEVFSGYPTLRRATWLWRLQKLPAPVRQAVVAVAGMAPSLRKLAFLRRQGRLPFYLVQRGVFTPQEAAQLVGASEDDAWRAVLDLEPSEWPSHPVVLQQYLESRYYLVDQLLKDADVFGMAHSVEVRVPFLDHVLVEAALSSPLSWRFDDRWPKVLLTKALRDLLPGEVVFRRKQGFTFPMDMWLRTHGSAFGDTVSVVSKRGRDAVWEAFLSGRSHWSRPWALEVLAHVNK